MNFSLAVFRRFGLYFLSACVVALALSWPVYYQYEQELEQTVMMRQLGYLDITERMVHQELFGVSGDLQVLAESKRVYDFLDAPAPDKRAALEEYFSRVAQTYQRYDQIRLIDLKGMELVRVTHRNGKTRVIPRQDRAVKFDRYYFEQAQEMPAGQVYVSPLDLNVENGQIEVPHVPMIRAAVPVNDSAGNRRAILVLNYRAEGLLEAFRATMAQSAHHQGMLLNAEGQWLSNHSRSNEWGWMLGHPESSFASHHPELWPQISSGSQGEIRNANGVYLYRSIYPLKFSASELPNAASAQSLGIAPALINSYRWELVIFVPRAAWLAESFMRQPAGWAAAGGMVVLLALVSLAFAAQRVSRQAIAQERLRNAKELEDLYDYAPCGYHSVDALGRVVRMNKTELDWLGYERGEVVGMRYADLAPPECRPELEQRFARFVHGEALEDFQIFMQRKDGSIFPVSINSGAVHSPSGEFVLSRTTIMDITERRRLELALEQQAQTDTLTGVFNRRHFYELGRRELARAERQGCTLALLLFDIDHFKQVNDSFGHPVGDMALKALTQVCLTKLRNVDVFARIGGEEFAALLPDTDLAGAVLVANRLREMVAQMRLSLAGGQSLSYTVSIGVAVHAPEQGPATGDLDGLLQRADVQLYRAKDSGRNRVCS